MLAAMWTTTRFLVQVPGDDADARCLIGCIQTGQLDENGENLIAILLNASRSEPLGFEKLMGSGRSTPRNLSQGCVRCDDVRRNGVTFRALPTPILQAAQNFLFIQREILVVILSGIGSRYLGSVWLFVVGNHVSWVCLSSLASQANELELVVEISEEEPVIHEAIDQCVDLRFLHVAQRTEEWRTVALNAALNRALKQRGSGRSCRPGMGHWRQSSRRGSHLRM